MYYPNVPQQAKYPEIEERVLAYWKANSTFKKSIENLPPSEKGGAEYVFYDGPPFANGLPHYGHLLTGFVKDAIPRFQTMRGKRVDRRFGWDCHGLPAEMEAEKELKVSGRAQIQEYGIGKFNEYCRKSVLRYTQEWENYVTRQARWVSFENDYKTMDLSYMESVIWAFKELYNKGLIYEGYKVMPYSWACETPLSNFETRLDNSYRPRQDPALTVAFTLLPKNGDPLPLKILAWTTTPWTLPSNLALAVGPDIEYAIIEKNGAGYIIARALLEKYEPELGDGIDRGSIMGRELAERKYEPILPYFKDHKNAFRVLPGDFVSLEEGTGIVHMAPGFGEDDQKLCESNNISLVVPVDIKGRFTSDISDFQGELVFDANKGIIKKLKESGVVLRHETYTHNYPHCWRTDTPIIYRALNSWYVRVTEFRDRLIERNKEINWIPSHIREGQFGKWISNARDWSISRSRFWGTPIPIWRSDDPKYPRLDVYGSLDEIERDFGVRPNDLHKPYIDELVRPNPDDPTGKSMMRRVDDVFDCWFESGSMPFAQIHYPFENKEWFEKHFPADFIVEYVAQTRGWFYTLVVLGVALFDKPPFCNCMCHGVVLDENGQKLSKRLRNYPSPEEVFSTYGADALRWFLIGSPILKGSDLQIDKEGKAIGEIVRTVINPIWNTWYFFSLYANTDKIKASFNTKSPALLDRYILGKTRTLIESVQEFMEAYDIASACASVTSFLDALTNWYIRRSRDRFWKHDKDEDKKLAYDTLYTVLHTVCKVCAPLLPLITEEVYRGLTNEESVHLSKWPNASEFPKEEALTKEMDLVRDVCSAALSIRESNELRTRLPLRSLTVASPESPRIKSYTDIIRDELNVKDVKLASDVSSFATFRLEVNARELGPKLGSKMKDVIKASKDGSWKRNPDGSVEVSGTTLQPGEFTLKLVPKENVAAEALNDNTAVVVLDVNVTPDLEEEGFARDVVRVVQQARKDAGLHVSDHISLDLSASGKIQKAVTSHKVYISEQTLAKNFSVNGGGDASWFSHETEIGGEKLSLKLSRIS